MSEHLNITNYPNGSYEARHKVVSGIGWIVAPNPFGTTWRMNFDGTKLFGAGFPGGIHRRGRKWYLHYEPNVGYTWITR